MQRNDAKAMEVLSNAEGVIAPLMKEFNMHEVQKLKMSVFAALAKNGDVVLSPSGTSADTQTMLLVDKILSNSSKLHVEICFISNKSALVCNRWFWLSQ